MKETYYDSREAWLNARLGNIGGSSVKEIVNLRDGELKPGLFRAAAESIIGSAAIAEGDLSKQQVLDRGHELEKRAIERFERETGKEVRKGIHIWAREDDQRITVSPDGPIGTKEAVECKALLSPGHLEVLYTQEVPREYHYQKLQYFVANEALETLHFCFFHPDFPTGLDFFTITFTRAQLAPEIEKLLAAEREATANIRKIVNAISLYSPKEMAAMKAMQDELQASAKADHQKGKEAIAKKIIKKAAKKKAV